MTANPAGVRARAVRDLLRIEVGGAYISKVRHTGEDADTMRQVTDLVAGVTRWRRYLDFLLAAYYDGNLHKMDPKLKQILRLAVFERYVLTRPPHAAIHSAVQLAKELVRPGAGRLVNAILRNMQRSSLPEPATGDRTDDLAIQWSHPTWMVRRWLAQMGPDATRSLLAHNNRRPWYGLRCNTLRDTTSSLARRLDASGIPYARSRYLSDFVRVARIGGILRAGLLRAGHCAVQDEGAGLVVRLLDPRPGETVLDLCAAPGGKTTYVATRMQNQGLVIAVDQHEGRLRQVTSAADAQQITIIRTRLSDATVLRAPPADRVLLDAPCTGTGVLAKRADLRWRRMPADLYRIIRVQDRLLDTASRHLRPGGVLVYGTCSLEAEENEQRVRAFLQRHPAFELESADQLLPCEVVTKEGYLQTVPPAHTADGTFAARLRRT